MKRLIFAFLSASVCLIVAGSQAWAAVWAWGCVGQLGAQQVIFNRNLLVVLPAKAAVGKLRNLIHKEDLFEIAVDGNNRFEPTDVNSGFEQTMEFTRQGEPGQKLTLTEKSSRKMSERIGHIGRREENTTTFKKVYRYVREHEPSQDITMDCMEYQLSTQGGR
jgi:hypothetical protein